MCLYCCVFVSVLPHVTSYVTVLFSNCTIFLVSVMDKVYTSMVKFKLGVRLDVTLIKTILLPLWRMVTSQSLDWMYLVSDRRLN